MAVEPEIHFYEPGQGHGLSHDPFNSIVAPRPIGWISSINAGAVLNLAPYSFFNAFNYVPPIIGFSSVGWKDSVANIADTGEFVWNLATRSLGAAMNATSAAVPAGVDEFAISGLTTAASKLVRPPRVRESPVSFECRLTQMIRLERADRQAIDSWLVLGEVVGVHIATRLLVDGMYDTVAAAPILRGGGASDYFEISAGDRFHMRRPREEQA